MASSCDGGAAASGSMASFGWTPFLILVTTSVASGVILWGVLDPGSGGDGPSPSPSPGPHPSTPFVFPMQLPPDGEPPEIGAAAPAARIAILGETHGVRPVTRALVEASISLGAHGCLCPGDFVYGDPDGNPDTWSRMMGKLSDPMLPALGNHDRWKDWSRIFPGDTPWYEQSVEGVHVISLSTSSSLARGSPQRVWLDATLEAAEPETLKIVILHRPWWLPAGAVHPASEFHKETGLPVAEMDRLMRGGGVDLVIAGHEKNYQHSLVEGVHYLIQGSAGPSFYRLGPPPQGSIERLSPGNAFTVADLGADRIAVRTWTAERGLLEGFVIPAPGLGLQVMLVGEPGEDVVAVEVAADARVVAVEVSHNAGEWRPLSRGDGSRWEIPAPQEEGFLELRAHLPDGRVAHAAQVFEWRGAA